MPCSRITIDEASTAGSTPQMRHRTVRARPEDGHLDAVSGGRSAGRGGVRRRRGRLRAPWLGVLAALQLPRGAYFGELFDRARSGSWPGHALPSLFTRGFENRAGEETDHSLCFSAGEGPGAASPSAGTAACVVEWPHGVHFSSLGGSVSKPVASVTGRASMSARERISATASPLRWSRRPAARISRISSAPTSWSFVW